MTPEARRVVTLTAWGALWQVASRWVNVLLSIATVLILARFIQPELWGAFTLAMIPIMLLQALVDGGLCEGLIRRQDLAQGHVDAAAWISMGAAASAFAVFCLLLAVGAVGDAGAEALALPLGSLILAAGISAAPAAILQREIRHGASGAAEIAAGILASLVGLGSAFMGFGVWSLVWMELSRSWLRCIWLVVASGWRPGLQARWIHVTELAAHGGSAIGMRLISAMDKAVPRLVVAAFFGQGPLGLFAMAMRIYDIVSGMLTGPMSALALAAAARLKQDRQTLQTMLRGAIKLSSTIAFPAFVGLILAAPIMVRMAFGEAWIGATLMLQVLALLGLRSAISSFNGGLLRGSDHAMWQLGVLVAGLVAITGLAPLAAFIGGSPVWVAAAIVARGFITWPLAAMLVQRATGFPASEQFKSGGAALLASLAMAAGVVLMDRFALQEQSDLIRLAAYLGVGALLYFAALAAFAPALVKQVLIAVRHACGGDRAGAVSALRALI